MPIQPMQACAADIEKVRAKYSKSLEYTMEPKLDGWRCIATRHSFDGPVTLHTRTGHSMTEKLPHIVAELENLSGPWILDGEVGYVGRMFYDWPILNYNLTARVLGSDIEEALRKQLVPSEVDQYIKFFVFDNALDDHYPLRGRRNSPVFMKLEKAYYESAIEYIVPLDGQGWDEDIYNQYVEAGGEGVMLKHMESLYHSGKRPANQWLKLKKFETVSCKIIDFVDGMGKYSDTIGAIVFVSQEGILGNCSGMDDETRYFIGMNKGALLDRYIEVKHYGKVGKDEEGYRHPQFLHFRPDLDH